MYVKSSGAQSARFVASGKATGVLSDPRNNQVNIGCAGETCNPCNRIGHFGCEGESIRPGLTTGNLDESESS